MHSPTIEKHRPFVKVPTTVEDIAEVFQAQQKEQKEAQNTLHLYDNIDDLLVEMGKQHDRVLLHQIVAQLFGVPSVVLLEAVNHKNPGLLVPQSVV